MNRTVRAFDPQLIHAGNRGLEIDHEAVSAALTELLAKLDQRQLRHEIRGRQPAPIDGLYYAGGDEAAGVPTYRMVDGPRGARVGKATAFPVAIARAASFDMDLERRVGIAIGLEVAANGGNVLLAPTMNLLRHPGWGRAQETYSEDSFHTGAMAVAFVSGAQNHVLASPKHFAANNLENTRFEMSANADARALHELYLAHFQRVVEEAAAASIMSAYNKINGVYCSDDPWLLTQTLRERWGFKGFVESDWFLGTRSTAQALRAGLDIEMPSGYRRDDEKLDAAIEAGELTEEDITDAAARALYQKIAWDLDNLPTPSREVIECDEHLQLAREVAEKSLVLLKNDKTTLPLEDRQGMRIAVVGDLADKVNLGDRGSSMVTPSEAITPLAGISDRAADSEVVYFTSDAELNQLSEFDVTVLVTGLTYKEEGEFIPTAQIETEESELARGGDRVDLKLPEHELALLDRVTQHARSIVVVMEGGSAIEVDGWLDKVDALIMAWYPGAQGGHAIAAALFGERNPSGCMPVSVPRAMNQLMDWDVTALDVSHDLLHGYRWLDHHQLEPRFEFGFGLSYSSFEISDLRVKRSADGFELLTSVRNTSGPAGASVVQIYVATVDSSVFRVPRELKAFARVDLQPGEQVDVAFQIADSQLRYFDTATDDFQLEACGYEFQAGFSSRNLPLSSRWQLTDGDWSQA